MPLTLVDEKRLKRISEILEQYYALKYLVQYGELLMSAPVPFEPVPPRPYAQGGWAGYTPDPEDPDPPLGPWPWPGPPPWWRVGLEARVIEMLDSPQVRLGRILGDSKPQSDLVSTVRGKDFHVKSAESALQSLDSACAALRKNIAALKEGT